MDLPSYYRHQADSARRLARVYHAQRDTKAALDRVAQEYDRIADDVEEWCGPDPARRYDLAAYIDAWRARWQVIAFRAVPFDQAITVTQQTESANIEQGRTADIEPGRQTFRQVDDALAR